MPRCYMVKKSGLRHDDGPAPRSPTEASIAPPCYSPDKHQVYSSEQRESEYEVLGRGVAERSAADREAAHELLSLAASVPPLPPATVVNLVTLDAPPQPLYACAHPAPVYIITAPDAQHDLYQNGTSVAEVPVTYATILDPQPQIIYAPDATDLPEYKNVTPPPPAVGSEVYIEPIPSAPLSDNDSDESDELAPLLIDEPTSIPTPVIHSACKAKYVCTECGKRYATSSNLSRHKQTHWSLDSLAAKRCPECGKAYVSKPALAMHVLTHRMGHVCTVCGKKFSRPWLLRGHQRSHSGEKPYSCASCGKAFADRSNLRAHLQTHSSHKRYQCPRCHTTFALKAYLNKHLESACQGDD